MCQIGQGDGERRLGRCLGVAIGAHHPRRHLLGGTNQRGQQVQRIGARPLQVVQHQQRPCRPSHVGQIALHRFEHQPALLLRWYRPGRQRLDGLGCQLGKQADQPGTALQGSVALARRLPLDMPLQGFQQRGIGLLAAASLTAPLQHLPALRLRARAAASAKRRDLPMPGSPASNRSGGTRAVSSSPCMATRGPKKVARTVPSLVSLHLR